METLPVPEPAVGLSALSLDPTTSTTDSRTSVQPAAPLTTAKPSPTTTLPPQTIFPQRATEPDYTQSREDPFQFGSRYLRDEAAVFTHNAWDHVETDAAYQTHARAQYTFQRAHAVTPFDRRRFNAEPAKWWDRFYANNDTHFFKDRKWLRQEFPILADCTRAPSPAPPSGVRAPPPQRSVVLEVGAGAGNTAFPILAQNRNPRFMLHACDFSTRAVELLHGHEAYDPEHMRAEVWDIASVEEPLPPGVEEGSVDVVVLIFIFSALHPGQWAQAVRNVWRALKPGGEVCFRDYGRGDLAQVRFKKGRWLGENFYVRGDGTRVYFFEEDELRAIWGGGLKELANGVRHKTQDAATAEEAHTVAEVNDSEGGVHEELPDPYADLRERNGLDVPAFEIASLGVDRRLLVNRQKQLKMYRCWMQGQFRKPHLSSQSPDHAQSQDTLEDV
jgi:tRNAThr (cytosine32-N3)-methyltransferase